MRLSEMAAKKLSLDSIVNNSIVATVDLGAIEGGGMDCRVFDVDTDGKGYGTIIYVPNVTSEQLFPTVQREEVAEPVVK